MPRTLQLAHLTHLTTRTGLWEHALGAEPRVEHGMCVDDVARALVVTARIPSPSPDVDTMTRTYLSFLQAALHDDGTMHNRRNLDGTWGDDTSTHDHWGRALWAFGTAAAHLADPVLAGDARMAAATAMGTRSVHPRAMAYAALGAAQLLTVAPDDLQSRRIMLDARRLMRPAQADTAWPWPWGRLTYANAVIPQAMAKIGRHLEAHDLERDGLRLLTWLVAEQTLDGHLSMSPASGRAAGDRRPAFDQQPIEVAALAEAARTAYELTGEARWTDVIELCVRWFEGDNDSSVAVRDQETGGGYDGLEDGGVNQNQGAESTLAWLATLQLSQLDALAGVS
jgi:hypothetical protein